MLDILAIVLIAAGVSVPVGIGRRGTVPRRRDITWKRHAWSHPMPRALNCQHPCLRLAGVNAFKSDQKKGGCVSVDGLTHPKLRYFGSRGRSGRLYFLTSAHFFLQVGSLLVIGLSLFGIEQEHQDSLTNHSDCMTNTQMDSTLVPKISVLHTALMGVITR